MNYRHKFGAYLQLLKHYGRVFSENWKIRKKLGGSNFKKDEAEFLPAALEIQETPASPTLRITAMVIILFVLFVAGWSVFGRMDIVVSATGEIIPHERTKTIASIEVASVKAIHVVEGQAVHKGDVLIELDTGTIDTERDKASSSVFEAMLQAARSKALIAAVESGIPPRLPAVAGAPRLETAQAQAYLDGQYRDFQAKFQRIEESIRHYSEELKLVTQRANDYKELAKNHDVSTHAYLEKEQDRVTLEAQLADAQRQKTALMTEVRRMAYSDQAEAEKIVLSSRQDVLKNREHSRLLKLTSPIDGTVQQLSVFTVGGIVPAAQGLMKIVPKEDKIEVEAMLENKDIGFIKEGQPVDVKIDTYEYTKYGVMNGKVVKMSSDAIKDEKRGLLYSVIIELDRAALYYNGKTLPLNPGMSVKADIKTGSRRAIEYFLNPLLQQKRESLNER